MKSGLDTDRCMVPTYVISSWDFKPETCSDVPGIKPCIFKPYNEMDQNWTYQYLPRIFCALAFIVNPMFAFLIFSGKSTILGNYRFLLLYFAIFNMFYSVVNVAVPLDIHSYRYCFFLTIQNGWFVQNSEFDFQILVVRCSLVSASYAVLLNHFIYRYLVIRNSNLTGKNFHWYMVFSFIVLVLYYGVWHASCSILGRANMEIRQYVREEFQNISGNDVMNFNLIGTLFHEGSEETLIRSWVALSIWSGVSTVSIIMFSVLVIMIVKRLREITNNSSKKTSRFQIELMRALVVQTVIPIFISFTPCLLCWYSPMFGIQLSRGFNYVEISALGVFAFVDPVAIIMCLPIFRQRLFSF